MNATITTAKSKQEAIKEIGKAESTLYYLIITTDEGKAVINVGKKTYENVNNLTTKKK